VIDNIAKDLDFLREISIEVDFVQQVDDGLNL